MGMMFAVYAVPTVLGLAFVAWAVADPPPAPTGPAASRWSRPSCSRAGSGRWCAPTASCSGGAQLALAVDADGRGAAARAGQRRAEGASRRRRHRRPSRNCRRPRQLNAASPDAAPAAPASRSRPRRPRRPHRRRRRRSGRRRNRAGVARLPRPATRRHRPRRAHQHRLVGVAAGRDVAPADRTGLVVVRGPRRSALHAGAARRRRDRRLLPGLHRRAGVAASRPGPILGIERRRRSARDADAQQRSRLRVRRDRNPERARRRAPAPWSGRATPRPTQPRACPTGASPARRWSIDDLVIVAAVGTLAAYDACDRQAALARPASAVGSYSSPHSGDDRRRHADPAAERNGRSQRRAGERHAALGARSGLAAPPSCSRR